MSLELTRDKLDLAALLHVIYVEESLNSKSSNAM